MSRTRVNYKSDLPPIEVSFGLSGAAVPIPIPDSIDFFLRFFVDGAPGESYLCGRKGGEYFNCEKKDDSTVICYIDHHKFDCGRLCVEFISLVPNVKYADGMKKTVTPTRLDIVLVDGPGDESENIDASVMIDLETVLAELQEALDTIDGKLDYYDANWVVNEEGDDDDFTALMAAILAGKAIVIGGQVVYATRRTANAIRIIINRGKDVNVWDITRSGGVVTVENDPFTLVETSDLDAYYTKTAANALFATIASLQNYILKSDIADNLNTNSTTKVLSAKQGKILNEKKANYYDASWVLDDEEYSVANFNNLFAAADTDKLVYVGGKYYLASKVYDGGTQDTPFDKLVHLAGEYVAYGSYAYYVNYYVKLYNNTVTVREGDDYVIPKMSDVTALGNRMTTVEGKFATLASSTGASMVGYTNNAQGFSGKTKVNEALDHIIDTTPRYQSAGWFLSNNPTVTNYDGMATAITNGKLILLNGVPASSATIVDSTHFTVSFNIDDVVRTYSVSKSGSTVSVSHTDTTLQEQLVSGTNIKTVNNQSLLGSGNITISGGGGSGEQSDWDETDTSSLAYIKNKPTIPTVPTNVGAFINDAGYVDADPTVGQNKTTNNADYHLLLTGGDGTADRAVSESKYSTSLDFNPSTKLVKLSSSYKEGSGILETTFNTDIQIGGAGLSIVKKQAGSTIATGNLSATNYSGTAAKATADGSGNTISTTYSTKSELSNYCPIIEDTRSSAVAAITGVAPFASLETGQKILLHLAYNTASNATLNLTLSDGTTTTGTKTMKIAYNTSFVDVGTGYTYIAGCYIPLIYNGTNWRVTGRENDTTYSSMTQANINSGTATTNTVSAKLIHDNAYIVETTYSSGSLKANKMYDFGTVSTALTIPSLDATNDLVSNALNFYALRFIAGADNLSITFPTGVEVDDTPTINTGDYVEIMINKYGSNFYASIKVWQAPSQNS